MRLQVVPVTILFLAICVLILPVEGFVMKNITAPTVITESGYYILQNDIINCDADVCIEIKANDVVLDGQGHVIDGIGKQNSIGILATDVENVTITNLTLQEWDYSIKTNNFANSTVSNTTLSANLHGAQLYGFSYSNFTSNQIIYDSVTINGKNSTISNNYFGIFTRLYLDGSSCNIITNNSFKNSRGFIMGYSKFNRISNNSFDNCDYPFRVYGSDLEDYIQYVDDNNLIDGKRLLYIVNESNSELNLSNSALTYIVNSDNVIISDIEMLNVWGLHFIYTNNSILRFVKIVSGGAEYYPYGEVLTITFCQNVTLYSIEMTDNDISIRKSKNISILNSNFNDVRIEVYDSLSLNVSNNTFNHTDVEFWSIYNSKISSNVFNNSHVHLSHVSNNIFENSALIDTTLRLWDSSSNIINDNIIFRHYLPYYSQFSAVELNGNYNAFTGNIIAYYHTGLTIGGNFNKIYGNCFNNTVNAHVSSDQINYWNETIGNYWSDYEGNDSDGDGIGDEPYIINDKNVDFRPLMYCPLNVTIPTPIPTPEPTPTPTPPPPSKPQPDQYEYDDDRINAKKIDVNTSQKRSFHYLKDVDWLYFNAVKGAKYEIYTYNLEGVDTAVYLFDSNGKFITSNDDINSERESKISWTCPLTGTYYIKVINVQTTTGDYTIKISKVSETKSTATSTHKSGGGAGGGGYTIRQSPSGNEFSETVRVEMHHVFKVPEQIIQKTGVLSVAVGTDGIDTVTFKVTIPSNYVTPPYQHYSVFELSVNSEKKLKTAYIYFRVSKQWIEDNKVDKELVVLMKYDENMNKWIDLPTVVDSEDETYVYYKSSVKSFSLFAIVVKNVNTTVMPLTTTTVSPTTSNTIQTTAKYTKNEHIEWLKSDWLIVVSFVLGIISAGLILGWTTKKKR